MRHNQLYFLHNVLYMLRFLHALYGFLRRFYFWRPWQISSDIKKACNADKKKSRRKNPTALLLLFHFVKHTTNIINNAISKKVVIFLCLPF